MFELEHLTIGYAKRQVITDLSLTIPEQTILAILGPSGSGKTTLLNAIAGLLPHSGEIYLNARPVTPKQATLALVPQDYGLLPWKRVIQNIELDTVIKRRAQQLFLAQWQQSPVTTLMVTHDLKEALQLSDQILILTKDQPRLIKNPLQAITFAKRDHPEILTPALTKLEGLVSTLW